MGQIREFNGFQYRIDQEYLHVFFEPTVHKNGYISSFRLLSRPFFSLEEFIINGKTYECNDIQTFECFDPENSEHLERTGIGLSWPNSGLQKFYELVNVIENR